MGRKRGRARTERVTSDGRGRDRGTPEAPSVSDDPGQIAEIWRLRQQEEDAVYKTALEELDGMALFKAKYRSALERRKDQARADLKRIVEDPAAKGKLRARAAIALVAMGDRSGADFLLDAVRDGRGWRRIDALHAICDGNLIWEVDLDHPERDRLILACLDDPDLDIVHAAARLCVKRKIPGTEAKLVALLEAGKGTNPLYLPNQLALIAKSPEAIRVMLDHLLRGRPRDYPGWFRSVLEPLIEGPDPEVSELVRVAFLRYTLGYTGKMRYHQKVVCDMSYVADRTTIPVLEDIVANATDAISRFHALNALARLEPERAIDRAMPFIRAEPRCYLVARFLRKWAAETDADRILDAISGAYTPAEPPPTFEELPLLLGRLGPRGRAIVEESLDRLAPHERMIATWKLEGLTVDAVLDDLRAAGVIKMSRDAVFEEIRRSRARFEKFTPIDHSSPGSVIDVLLTAGILTLAFFDITGELPHEEVMSFAASSGGAFDPECVVQTRHQKDKEDIDAPDTVQFLYKGRLYRFGVVSDGGYDDVKAVQRALNFALETAGRKERFIRLDLGFVFADPAAFRPIAAKYALHLTDDDGPLDRAATVRERG